MIRWWRMHCANCRVPSILRFAWELKPTRCWRCGSEHITVEDVA